MDGLKVLIFCENSEVCEITDMMIERSWPEIQRDYYLFSHLREDQPDFQNYNCLVLFDYLDPKFHRAFAEKYIGVHALRLIKQVEYRGDLMVSLAGVSGNQFGLCKQYSPIEISSRNSVIEKNVCADNFKGFNRVYFIPDYCSHGLPNFLKSIYSVKVEAH